MIIRKLYRIESAHIVRNAISKRCSNNYHGHSGVIEVFFKSCPDTFTAKYISKREDTEVVLDNAGMIYDFGAMKETIGTFIDMFDHAVHLYKNDDPENIEFFKKANDRYIILPCNTTAENYSLLFRDCINEILRVSKFTNGEGFVYCSGVRYHETATGYAESEESDDKRYSIKDIEFSPSIIEELKDNSLIKYLTT